MRVTGTEGLLGAVVRGCVSYGKSDREYSVWVVRMGVGRKPSVDVEKVSELRDSGMGASAIAKELGIGRASVYRALGEVSLNTLCISYGHIHGQGFRI
jgi:DNA invertase Pin-like site-specific DNA recombinase